MKIGAPFGALSFCVINIFMYITDKFVYLHVPKTAGTTVMRNLLPAMSRGKYGMYLKRYENTYHKHVQFLPEEHQHLPRLGFVRNPWAWYPSWLSWAMTIGDRPTAVVFTEGLDPSKPNFFTDTIKRLLTLDDGTEGSNKRKQRMETMYSKSSRTALQQSFMCPHNYAKHAESFGAGYYTWWHRSVLYGIFKPQPADSITIGKVENFTSDYLLFVGKHTDMTIEYAEYVQDAEAQRVRKHKYPYQDHYDFELAALIAEKDKGIINKYGYQFNQEEKLS